MKLVVAVLLLAFAEPTRADVDFSDTPAWTEEIGRILLLWDVGPDRKNPKDPYGDGFGLPLRPVDLVAQLGKVTRRIKLSPETGNLFVYNQVICKTGAYPLAGKEVGKLTFYEGGASGYSVVRAGQDLLEVHHWSQTDGHARDRTTQWSRVRSRTNSWRACTSRRVRRSAAGRSS